MDSLSIKKREFRLLLPNDGIMPLIDSLRTIVVETSEKYKTLLLIESHYKEVRNRQQQGVIRLDTLHLEENGTRKKLLDFIDDLEERDIYFIDLRDDQIYITVELLGKIWMAENFNFDIGEGCWSYNDNPENREKYGLLYNWSAAKRACPQGWRLPTSKEWRKLFYLFGGKNKAYPYLISGGNSGFSAQLGGSYSVAGKFYALDSLGYYWSAERSSSDKSWFFYFSHLYSKICEGDYNKTQGLSCRYVRDF